jgi:hypothetical protein
MEDIFYSNSSESHDNNIYYFNIYYLYFDVPNGGGYNIISDGVNIDPYQRFLIPEWKIQQNY